MMGLLTTAFTEANVFVFSAHDNIAGVAAQYLRLDAFLM